MFEFTTDQLIAAGIVIAIIAILAKRKKKKSKKSKRLNWIYIDDVTTEGNGPQDWICVLGLTHVFGPPIFMGATEEKGRGTGVDWARATNRVAGMQKLLVFEGTHGHGIDHPSPLSREIVKHANLTGDLHICVGGLWTDVGTAIRMDPGIAKKITVYGIAASNATNDPKAYNYVKQSGCKVIEWGVNELWPIIKSGVGLKWLETHFKRSDVGQRALTRHWLAENINNNIGQAGANTPVRIADCFTVIAAHMGKDVTKSAGKMLPIIEKGLSKL